MRIAGKQLPISRKDIEQHVDLSSLPAGTDVKAYVLMHEGESRPVDQDTGRKLSLHWGGAMVRRVAALARKGIKFVRSHTDRTEVGEVLGSWTAEVAGRLAAIVAGRFDAGQADNMDVCSLEASGVQQHAGTVLDVESLDAVALGNSRHDTPGFPGAMLAGSIMAFTEPGGAGGETTVTIKEIREWLETNPGVLPGQLFSDEAIAAHPSVATKLAELEKQTTDLTGKIARRDAKDALTAKITDWTDEARFYVETAFDGWTEASNDPSALDEWIKGRREHFKAAHKGQDVLKPKQDEDPPGTNWNQPGGGNEQPNQPPAGGGKDVVAQNMAALGIVKAKAA